jgi:hypothetical protein
MILAGAFLCLSVTGVAHAGPLIAAEAVSLMCQVQGNTVNSVSVALNGVTSSFYGTSLRYHFAPDAGGSTIILASPTPLTSPVKLSVPAGAYKLIISPNLTLTPSASQSPHYPVTVPGDLVVSLGQKKICNHRYLRAKPRL